MLSFVSFFFVNCFILLPSLLFPILVFHFWYPITILIVSPLSCHHTCCLLAIHVIPFAYSCHPITILIVSIIVHFVRTLSMWFFIAFLTICCPSFQNFPILMIAKLGHLLNYNVSFQSHFDLEFLLKQ
jgi:hypothetical protein